jgi:tetratricopeptide (TPR) repeat protein
MKKEGAGVEKSKGYRSRALLDMYRGRYAAATEQLREAVLINQGSREEVSEFRDRMYLITSLEARNQVRQADAAWLESHRLIARLSLAPSWLSRPVRMLARRGRIREAGRLLTLMHKTAGSATADASVAYNTAVDRPYIDLAQAEIELAAGRPARAIELLGPIREALRLEALESLAAAYSAAGRVPEAIASYEEFLRKPQLGAELQEIWLGSHVALGTLYEKSKRADDARRVYSTLVELWKGGDDDLVLLRVARERLARLTAVP